MSVQKPKKNWLEWLVFGISLLLILLVVGLLSRQALSSENRPPDLEVTLGEHQQSSQGITVPVSVINRGDQTAQQVGIEVRAAGSFSENSDLSFDFVAPGEKREGWVAFSASPTQLTLSARVKGYVVR